jgi:hypothetical protein
MGSYCFDRHGTTGGVRFRFRAWDSEICRFQNVKNASIGVKGSITVLPQRRQPDCGISRTVSVETYANVNPYASGGGRSKSWVKRLKWRSVMWI